MHQGSFGALVCEPVSSRPHPGDAPACVDVPEADIRVAHRAVDGRHGLHEAFGDDVESRVSVGQTEQMPGSERGEFVGAVSDAVGSLQRSTPRPRSAGRRRDRTRRRGARCSRRHAVVVPRPSPGCGRRRTQAACRRTSSTTFSARLYSSATAVIGSPVRHSATTSSTLTLLLANTGAPQPNRGSMTTSAPAG